MGSGRWFIIAWSGLVMTRGSWPIRYTLFVQDQLDMVAQKLQWFSPMRWDSSAIENHRWSGSKSYCYRRKIWVNARNSFISKRSNGLGDFAVIESVLTTSEVWRKYVFEITSAPVALRDQTMMVHLMSFRDQNCRSGTSRDIWSVTLIFIGRERMDLA